MPKMNDSDRTEINLSKIKLTGVKYTGDHKLGINYMLDSVQIESTLSYGTQSDARDDYQMLIDMLNASEGTRELLQETFNGS